MNIPRFAKNPVDTYILQRCRRYNPKADMTTPIETRIRKAIKKIQGYDPLEQNNCRNGELVKSRQLFATLMSKYTRLTFQEIADLMEKDHSTISTSIKKVSDLRFSDKHYDEMYKLIEKEVRNN